MIHRFENQVAIVTGAGRGIGAATARRLASEGAAVVVADVDLEPMEEVAQASRAAGGEALALRLDVTVRAQVEQVLAAAIAEYKQVDVLANIAGIATEENFLLVSDENWQRTLQTNLTGVFLC